MLLAEKYELLEPLGEGSMGVVYRARHVLLDVELAVKIVRPQYSADEAFRKRFLREAKLPMTFVHKRSVTLRDFGRDADGSLYLVMDLSPGKPLSSVIRSTGGLDSSRACQIALQVLEVLTEAHAFNIIHRDIKPDNIMVDGASGSDQVKVLDFGIAKLMEGDASETNLTAGSAIGTPLYMSPEQAAGEKLDRRSDLYSLGVVLFEMLCGEPPFNADRVQALLMKHLTQPVPDTLKRRGIDAALEKIVQTALAKTVETRFQDAQSFAQALQGWLDQHKLKPVERTLGDTAIPTTLVAAALKPGDSAPFKAVRPVQEREGDELDEEGLDSVSMVSPAGEGARRPAAHKAEHGSGEAPAILQSSVLKEEAEQVRAARVALRGDALEKPPLSRGLRLGLTFLSVPVLALILTSIWLSLADEVPPRMKELAVELPGLMRPLSILPGFSRLTEDEALTASPTPTLATPTPMPPTLTPAPTRVRTPRTRPQPEAPTVVSVPQQSPSSAGAYMLNLKDEVTDYFVPKRSVVLMGPVPGGGERARINGEEVFVVDGSLSHRLELKEGLNEVLVVGSKDQRNTTSNLNITVDSQRPKLRWTRPLPNRLVMRPVFKVEFTVSEPNLKQVTVNGEQVTGEAGRYTFELRLASGKNPVLVVAEDQAGHRMELKDVILH
ncbi:MAG: protein kinase domain-containing protein [Myxococcota bacterium]